MDEYCEDEPLDLTVFSDINYFADVETFLQVLDEKDDEEAVWNADNLVQEQQTTPTASTTSDQDIVTSSDYSASQTIPQSEPIQQQPQLSSRKRKSTPKKLLQLDEETKDEESGVTVKISPAQPVDLLQLCSFIRFCAGCRSNGRSHYHCDDPHCKKLKYLPAAAVERHVHFHKLKEQSRDKGFVRVASYESCASTMRSIPNWGNKRCPFSNVKTHYHCIRPGCGRVCSNVCEAESHRKHHSHAERLHVTGFVRYAASEQCNSMDCDFRFAKTTHYHCAKEGCSMSFKKRWLIDGHKLFHEKNDQFESKGWNKFNKRVPCQFNSCMYSGIYNHFHCIREGCGYTVATSHKVASHDNHHDQLDELSRTNPSLTSHRTAKRLIHDQSESTDKISCKSSGEIFMAKNVAVLSPHMRARKIAMEKAKKRAFREVNTFQVTPKVGKNSSGLRRRLNTPPLRNSRTRLSATSSSSSSAIGSPTSPKSEEMDPRSRKKEMARKIKNANFKLYLRQSCPRYLDCALFRYRHFHCGEPTCTYANVSFTQMESHDKRHQKIKTKIADGIKNFTKYEDCSVDGCKFKMNKSHFHCVHCRYACISSTNTIAHVNKQHKTERKATETSFEPAVRARRN
ncbi:uncharacterized protein LOC142339908 [Convolutriloba macropyga]|uniref:uncharacterized protein LOC142339908 n=1 Tax=Convolutriloba macropyga TaxID=536237 RepID=UPI003F51F421